MVIGGGLAGLSSAVALAEAGLRVRLLEKRPHLGGRAASYVLPGGEHIDNCQHVTLGCCTNLEDFYRRAGAANQIRFFDRLIFAAPDGRRGAIAAVSLPPPLHMAPSFAFFPLLGLADKRGIALALLAIARSGGRPGDLATSVPRRKRDHARVAAKAWPDGASHSSLLGGHPGQRAGRRTGSHRRALRHRRVLESFSIHARRISWWEFRASLLASCGRRLPQVAGRAGRGS